MNRNELKVLTGVVGGIIALVVLIWVFMSINVINETERGITKRGGKIVAINQAGYNIVLYPIYTVERLSIQQDTNRFTGVIAKTHDEQVVSTDVSVTYRLRSDDESLKQFYRDYQKMDNFVEKILRRNITNQMQIVMGKFTAQNTVRQKGEMDQMYYDLLSKSLKNTPVEIISVQVERIVFSDAYTQRIEKRMEAEVEIMTRKQNKETADIENEIRINKAKTESEARILESKAKAEGITLVAEAEAKALDIKGEAIRKNGSGIIELMRIEKWDGVQPRMIMGGGAMPLINMDTK